MPAPEYGWPRAGLMALTHFWRLIEVNILFVLFSLPVFTLPAALTALNRVCVIVYKVGNIFLWEEFWKTFRQNLLRTIFPGFGFALLLFGGYFYMSLGYGNMQYGLMSVLLWTIGILMASAAVTWGEYFFVVLAVLDISVLGALKNAFILYFSRPVNGLISLAVVVACGAAIAALMPVGLFFIPVVSVVLVQYPICYLVYDVTEDLVLIPYREKMEKEKENGGQTS